MDATKDTTTSEGDREKKAAQAVQKPTRNGSARRIEAGQRKDAVRQAGKQAITLAELAERYIQHLEEEGKSHGTCFSYSIEMRTALKVLGADTLISSLTVDDVRRFYNSGPVTMLKSGQAKSPLSVAKSRRVARMALTWAAEQGWLQKAPLPEAADVK